jgi:hypothetical protein
LRGRGGAFGKSTPSKRRTSYVAVRLFFLCVKDFEGVVGGTFLKSPPLCRPPAFPRLEKSDFFHIFLFLGVSRLFFAKNCGKLCGNCAKLSIFAIFNFSQLWKTFPVFAVKHFSNFPTFPFRQLRYAKRKPLDFFRNLCYT